MGIKWYDSREGWLSRGYEVSRGEGPIGYDTSGADVFAWGQVRPLDGSKKDSLGILDEAVTRKGRHLEGVEEATNGGKSS